MKRLALLIVFIMSFMAVQLVVTGCAKKTLTPALVSIPTIVSLPAVSKEAPDDVIASPAGFAYRANVTEIGVENPWPPVETVEVKLGSGSSTVYLRYRNHIVTKAGEIRNNIFYVRKTGSFFEGDTQSTMKLYYLGILPGLRLYQQDAGGSPGTVATVLVVEIPNDIEAGQYSLKIALEILGFGYNNIPCIVEVIQ